MRRVALLGTVVAAVFLAACPNPATTPPAASSGAVKLVINENVSTRSLLPATDMTIAKFDISGTGTDGSSINFSDLPVSDPQLAGSQMTLTDLWPGDWDFSVSAKNADSTVIGSWQGSGTVVVNQTTEVDVTIDPLVGQGTLALTIDFSSISQEAPNLLLTGSLVPAGSGGTIGFADADFSVLNGSNLRTSAKANVPNGYYTLMLSLAGSSAPATVLNTLVDSVRIVTGQTTTGTIIYPSLSGTANIIISSSPLMANAPLAITDFVANFTDEIFVPGSTLQFSEFDLVSIGVEYTDSLFSESPTHYQWFLVPYDAVNAVGSDQNNLTFNGESGDVVGIVPGTYRLYLILTKNAVAVSEYIDITVTPGLG